MIKTDFHTHTCLSVDAEAQIDQLVQRAIELGLTQIAITDHVDRNPSDEGTGKYDPAQAYDQTLRVRRQFGDRIEIRHGAELAEPHLYVLENEPVYRMPLDVVIGSIHYVDSFGIHSDLFDNMEMQRAIRGYFDSMLITADQADIDVLGHLDYFVRYTCRRNLPEFNPEDYRSQIENILDRIVARRIALEVNTSGCRSPAARCLPHPQVLTWYYQMGGRLISVGSDAHLPQHVAGDFDRALKLLLDAGFKEYHTYHQRQPIARPIGG